MSAIGADVEQLRKAAQIFRQKADYLESSISQGVSHQIDGSSELSVGDRVLSGGCG